MGLTLRERVRTRDGRDLHAAGTRTSRADSGCVTSSCGKREAAEQGRAGASGGGTAAGRAGLQSVIDSERQPPGADLGGAGDSEHGGAADNRPHGRA